MLVFIWKGKRPIIFNTVLKNNKVGVVSDFKTYYKPIINKRVRYW